MVLKSVVPITAVQSAVGLTPATDHRVRVTVEWRQNSPKSEQLADILKKRIDDGTYLANGRLPSERQLVYEFEVGRSTTRKALMQLREQGIAYIVCGLGTFVSPR